MQIELSIAKGFWLVFSELSDNACEVMCAAINGRPVPRYADEVNDYASEVVRLGYPAGREPPVYLQCPNGDAIRLEV